MLVWLVLVTPGVESEYVKYRWLLEWGCWFGLYWWHLELRVNMSSTGDCWSGDVGLACTGDTWSWEWICQVQVIAGVGMLVWLVLVTPGVESEYVKYRWLLEWGCWFGLYWWHLELRVNMSSTGDCWSGDVGLACTGDTWSWDWICQVQVIAGVGMLVWLVLVTPVVGSDYVKYRWLLEWGCQFGLYWWHLEFEVNMSTTGDCWSGDVSLACTGKYLKLGSSMSYTGDCWSGNVSFACTGDMWSLEKRSCQQQVIVGVGMSV